LLSLSVMNWILI